MSKSICNRITGHRKLQKLLFWVKHLHYNSSKSKLPPQIFLTDYRRINEKEYEKIFKALPKDTLIIIREYDHPEKYRHIEQLSNYCKKQRRPFLIAMEKKLAIKNKAHGVHLPEHMLNQATMIKKQHPNWVITAAIHSHNSLLKAQKNKSIDAVLVSPVFSTKSHVGKKSLRKILFISMLRSFSIPVYALGGVKTTTIAQLKNSKCHGIAAIEAYTQHK